MEVKSVFKFLLIIGKKITLRPNTFKSRRFYSDLKKENFKRVNDLKVAFFGTDLFSIKILNGLNKLLDEKKIKEISVITSVSPRDKFSKEKSKNLNNTEYEGILDFCKKKNIKYHVWSEIKINKNYKDILKDFDIGLVASFGHLLPSSLIEVFPW